MVNEHYLYFGAPKCHTKHFHLLCYLQIILVIQVNNSDLSILDLAQLHSLIKNLDLRRNLVVSLTEKCAHSLEDSGSVQDGHEKL